MTLDRIKRGCRCKILTLPTEQVRDQCIRFGIYEGETVNCCEVLPAGPVVISKNRQEIAIGRSLACKITVEEI